MEYTCRYGRTASAAMDGLRGIATHMGHSRYILILRSPCISLRIKLIRKSMMIMMTICTWTAGWFKGPVYGLLDCRTRAWVTGLPGHWIKASINHGQEGPVYAALYNMGFLGSSGGSIGWLPQKADCLLSRKGAIASYRGRHASFRGKMQLLPSP